MLSELVSTLADRQRDRANDYWKTVRSVAREESCKIDEIEAAIVQAGKTPEQFVTDSKRVQARIVLANKLANVAALEAEQSELAKQGNAADAKLEKAEQAHTKAIMPLDHRLTAIANELAESESAKGELMNACPYAALVTEAAEVLAALRESTKQAGELRTLAERVSRDRAYVTTMRERGEHHRNIAVFEREAIRFERQAAKLPDVEAELATLQARAAELEAEMLKP